MDQRFSKTYKCTAQHLPSAGLKIWEKKVDYAEFGVFFNTPGNHDSTEVARRYSEEACWKFLRQVAAILNRAFEPADHWHLSKDVLKAGITLVKAFPHGHSEPDEIKA